MGKKLPIKYPTITTYTQHAHLLAVLENNPKTMPWILSNYIELYADKNLREHAWMDFYFPMPYETRPMELCKWVEVQKNNIGFLNTLNNDLIELFLWFLNSGYYINVMVNYRYISKSNFGEMNVDKYHDLLIYGYDKDLRIFYCADFLFNSSGHYSFGICTFDEMKKAIHDEFENNKDPYLHHMMYSYKLQDDCNYTYDFDNVLIGIKQYYSGDVLEYWKRYENATLNNYTFGINCYDTIVQDLTDNKYNIVFDIVFLYLLMDHKKIMKKRLSFIQMQNDHININRCIEDYETIYNCFKLIVNMAIKGGIFEDYRVIERLIPKIKDAKSKEKYILEKLILNMEDAL